MTLVNQLHQRSASSYKNQKNKSKTNQTSEYAGGFGISPSIDDNRFTAISTSQPRQFDDDQKIVEYDIQSDPNLTLQEKIFCQLLLEDLETTENHYCADCCMPFTTQKKKPWQTNLGYRVLDLSVFE